MTQYPTELVTLSSFGTGLHVAVVGASGGIGAAFCRHLEACPEVAQVFRLSRSQPTDGGDWLPLDYADEASIAQVAATLKDQADELHLVILATGLLHEGAGLQPEKTWASLEPANLAQAFLVNATGPALVAKHMLPLLAKKRKTAFAALSARVGSIEDNQLGGWYAYRASKAALNMLLRSLAIELARRNKTAFCVGLHPGTVDTGLSKPFQRGVPERQLFTPERSARALLGVLEGLEEGDSGRLFAWDGQRIPF
ncbi:MAG: SDR family NAD(P)-dependent oxidoreductase [Pseudomonadota bacterium]